MNFSAAKSALDALGHSATRQLIFRLAETEGACLPADALRDDFGRLLPLLRAGLVKVGVCGGGLCYRLERDALADLGRFLTDVQWNGSPELSQVIGSDLRS